MIADIIIIGIIVFMIYKGFKRGLVLSLIRILSIVISIVLTWIAYPHVVRIFGANPLVNILIIIALFFLCKILLGVVAKALKLVTNLPVIRQFDSVGGGILGFLQGALIVYALLALIFIAVPVGNVALSEQFAVIHNQIDTSTIAVIMYNNNVILNLFNIQ